MLIYCLVCKKHTNNICPKKKLVMMTSKANGGISKRVDCLANKSFFDETYRANLLCKE